MSTILKSLKKLEQEKSVLDKDLNLRGLVLQDERDGASPKWRAWGLAFIVATGGIALGAALVAWWLEGTTPPETSGIAAPPVTQSVAPKVEPVASGPVYLGVPLASIPEVKRNTATPPETVGVAPPAPQPKALPPAPQNAEKFEPEAGASRDIAGIEASAPRLAPSPAQPVAGSHIPGFKLKGIIFFDDQSPSNYIFYATGRVSNKKLKVGESVLGATLKVIEPDRAVFTYKGHPVVIEIGD